MAYFTSIIYSLKRKILTFTNKGVVKAAMDGSNAFYGKCNL